MSVARRAAIKLMRNQLDTREDQVRAIPVVPGKDTRAQKEFALATIAAAREILDEAEERL